MLPFSPSTVIFSADGSASMPSWSASQKWKVISSICGHSTLRGSLVTLYKRISFISRPAPAYLSHPEWNEEGVAEEGSTASALQAVDSPLLFSFGEFLKFSEVSSVLLEVDCNNYSNCVFAPHQIFTFSRPACVLH